MTCFTLGQGRLRTFAATGLPKRLHYFTGWGRIRAGRIKKVLTFATFSLRGTRLKFSFAGVRNYEIFNLLTSNRLVADIEKN